MNFLYNIPDESTNNKILRRIGPSAFRNCDYNENINRFYHKPNIVKCAADVFQKLINFQEILVVSETQTGKTELMNRLMELSYLHKEDLLKFGININKIFICICASNKELKKDIDNKTWQFRVIRKVIHTDDMLKYYKEYDKFQFELNDFMEKSLIIFDESHADSEVQQTVDKFREMIGVNPNNIENKNVKIVTISATPYEQMLQNYPYVLLKPGKGYYGISDMFKLKRIHQAYNLNDKNNVSRLFKKYIKSNPKKYMIIRLPSNSLNEQKSIMKDIKEYLKEINPKFVIYDMSSDFEINQQYLNREPSKFTIIFIKDLLRMGKSINTKHICCVHDSPKNTYTHTTVQGLLGRASGYEKKNHNVEIYCDYNKAEKHKDWVESKFNVNHLPDKIKYIDKQQNVKKNNIYSIPFPNRISLHSDSTKSINSINQIDKKRNSKLDHDYNKLINEHNLFIKNIL